MTDAALFNLNPLCPQAPDLFTMARIVGRKSNSPVGANDAMPGQLLFTAGEHVGHKARRFTQPCRSGYVSVGSGRTARDGAHGRHHSGDPRRG